MGNKAKEKGKNPDLINIDSIRVKGLIGVSKYFNEDWHTVAYYIPRDRLYDTFTVKELYYNCIYFLLGFEEEKLKVYVGQAKKRIDGTSVITRLREHDKNKAENYCDKWSWVVVCTDDEDAWDVTSLNALEYLLYKEIRNQQSWNGCTPNHGGADFLRYADKIKYIKGYIESMQFDIFNSNDNNGKTLQITEIDENNPVENISPESKLPEIITPIKLVKDMCDMLPSEVWNDKTVFLDPACKGGEHLREIYNRLMESEILKTKYEDEFERSYHILDKQLYGVALSQTSLERTTKSLRGYANNIKIIPGYIEKLKGKGLGSKIDGTDKTMQDVLNEEFNREMKIDVVIGNPPYQCGGGVSFRMYFITNL